MKNFILILCLATFSQWVYAQNKQITGRVVDTKGEAAIGASILEKGTTNGTITDFDGNFKLTVGPKAVLQISYIGYKTQEIPVANKTKLNITMEEDTEVLDEVVVVGYGAQKKESVVGAISQVSSKELLKSPAANISQAIAGKISGVITSQTSGAPGSDDMKIYIRGRASFAGDNQPLILVDGVEREFSQIAPDDIESISTLKDASATAVYGVRGANGVMLITTKRGKEQKPTVSLTANWQIQSPTRQDTYLDSYNSVVLLEEALANDGLPSQYSASDIEMYKRASAGQLSGIDALLYPNVDWYDTVLRNSAPAQRYNVNIQGGTKRMRYFTSAEYYNQQGLFKEFSQDEYGNKSNSSFKRFAFRANLDFLMTKDLTLSVNFGTRFEERRGPNSNESRDGTYSQAFYEMNHTPGWLFPVSYTVGEGEDQKTLYSGSSQYQNNIVARFAKAGFYRSTNTINETNFIVDYKMDWLTKGLAAKGMVSFDYDAYYRRAFSADFATYELNDRTNYNSIDAYTQFNTDTELAYLGNDQTTTYKLYMEFQLNWARKFGKHDITAMALYNQNDYRYQADLAERYQGLVGRATYGYDDRYLAEVNFGYNGSENFAKGKRYGLFPSFALGWVISNEPFYKKSNISKIMNSLKIRGSLGWVGNDRVWAYDPVANTSTEARFIYLQQYEYVDTSNTDNSYIFGIGDNRVQGIRQGRVANKDVSWETSRKLNIGLEAGLFNNALTFNIDYFHERRSDILTQVQTMPSYVGTVFSPANIGIVQNQGVELEVNHSRFIGPDFSYSIKGNMSFARNKVIDMGTPLGVLPYQRPEGYPIDTPLKLITLGYFQDYDDIERSPSQLALEGNTEVHPGDLKYKDINGDGVIDRADFIRTGYPLVPEIQYGINLSLSYKGFDVGVLFQGSTHVSFDKNWEAMWAFSNGDNVYDKHWSYWTPEMGDANAKYTQMYGKYQNNEAGADYTLSDGSYIRLKNLDIGYTLPKKITEKAFIKTIRIYFSALNLATWAKEPYLDPDNRDNRAANMPPMKAYNFGLNINF